MRVLKFDINSIKSTTYRAMPPEAALQRSRLLWRHPVSLPPSLTASLGSASDPNGFDPARATNESFGETSLRANPLPPQVESASRGFRARARGSMLDGREHRGSKEQIVLSRAETSAIESRHVCRTQRRVLLPNGSRGHRDRSRPRPGQALQ